MLNLEGNVEKEWNIYVIFKCLPTGCLLVAREREENSNYTVEQSNNTEIRGLKFLSPDRGR